MADVEKLLVVGSGGREAAIIKEALQEGVGNVYSTRGKDAVDIGIEGVINTGLGEDVDSIGTWAHLNEVDLVVVGPEKPLVHGLADILRGKGIYVFGPGTDGAKFEDNKVETHNFALKYGLPNPDNSAAFTPDQREEAKDHIRSLGSQNVYTKRVGMEGGKGAKPYTKDELEKALAEVDAVADKGEDLVIQGRLTGPEYSLILMLDGNGGAVATTLSRDHKALLDGGEGPNTGGMGAFAPLTSEQASLARRKEIERIGLQIVDGLVEEGIDYKGAVYAGLMAKTKEPNSDLKLLEINVRFGDPETQVILQSLGGKAIEYMYACARGTGDSDMSRLYLDASRSLVSLSVCLASPGYPDGPILTGLPIHVPEVLPDDVSVQFAGAKMIDGKPVSSGGRVVYITKAANNVSDARAVYDYIGLQHDGLAIGNDEHVIRRDIGLV